MLVGDFRAVPGFQGNGAMMAKTAMSRVGVRVPPNRSFERELARLEAMSGHVVDAEGMERIRVALGKDNNFLVSKAARLVEDHSLIALLPEVLAAYDRFFEDAVKTDPQCWAKNALVKALVALECHDSAPYLRGLRHHQEEPVWGGRSDTAGALRGTCAHALVGCDGLSRTDVLNLLLEPFIDFDKTVRVEAARAIGHVGGVSAELILRLRILLRKEEPDVMSACFSALLGMESSGKSAIPLVAEFLDEGEEAAAEAAFALAETHEPSALAALLERRRKGADAWFGSVLDSAIALTRLPEATDFLLSVIERDARQAASALEAIGRVSQSAEMRARVAQSVAKAGSERLQIAFRQFFPPLGEVS